MNWNFLTETAQLADIKERSFSRPQVIFKYSTRCSISSVAKSRLDKNIDAGLADFHYLDLIAYRQVSNKIAEEFKVTHESPQVLLIRNGKCTYHESHLSIHPKDLEAEMATEIH